MQDPLAWTKGTMNIKEMVTVVMVTR